MRSCCIQFLSACLALGFALQAHGQSFGSRSDVLADKTGMVVDEKGAPLAGVTLIAAYSGARMDFMGGTHGGCGARRMAVSNENGKFSLPDVSSEPRFQESLLQTLDRWLARGSNYSWSLMAVKNGYIDEAAQNNFQDQKKLKAAGGIASLWSAPKMHSKFFGGVDLEPIVMKPSDLSQDDTIIYAGNVHQFSRSCDIAYPPKEPSPEYIAFDTAVIKSVELIPCNLAPDSPISAHGARAFYVLHGGVTSKSDPFFFSGQGTKDTFYSRMEIAAAGVPFGAYWQDTNAGTLCWAQGRLPQRP